MRLMYLCPLHVGSTFCLTGQLQMQRNCNAREADTTDSEDLSSISRSYANDLPGRKSLVQSSTVGTGIRKGSSDTCSNRVDFVPTKKSRDRPKSSKRARYPFGGSCGGADDQSDEQKPEVALSCRTTSMRLVPLTANQSNLHLLLENCANSEKEPSEATKDERGCNVKSSFSGKVQGNLLTDSAYPNLYDSPDFRLLENQVFDPQMDPCLHRESIILDNYNRLMRKNPSFLLPKRMYHLR